MCTYCIDTYVYLDTNYMCIHIVMLRKPGDAPRHKTIVSVLSLLSLALCQNPVGLRSKSGRFEASLYRDGKILT